MIFGKLVSGNSRKAKTFSFKPRYYDADKEEFKARYARIEAEVNGKSDSTPTLGSIGLKEKWKNNKRTSTFEKKSNTRLVFIAIILLALCYWLFYI